ncbi:MAG TPA: hypothetical protein VGI46_22050 [Candidatus Acidoferrum sp.]|jgi:hypothetical protein
MRLLRRLFIFAGVILIAASWVLGGPQKPTPLAPSSQGVELSQFIGTIRQKAKILENTSGMRGAFQSFLASHQLKPESLRYSDFVIVRLIYEATRDAGFWNMHWSVTDQPPNSDRIWSQWRAVVRPSMSEPTAIAECDELSALYAFLVERAGVKTVGLLWPTSNHTVAVWVVQPATGPVIRVVVPTSQIFLEETDSFDTKKFNPWRQKTIYEYTRRDVSDSFELPKPLVDFFLKQVDVYGGASDPTLQRLRYVRDAVFARTWTIEQAARDAESRRTALAPGSSEDAYALTNFAADMRLAPFRQ